MKMHPLTGSAVAKAADLLRTRWPDAAITAGQMFEDGQGAIVQFHIPSARYGQHATIAVRWDAGTPVFAGHYFDDGFQADVDFIYRARRGY